MNIRLSAGLLALVLASAAWAQAPAPAPATAPAATASSHFKTDKERMGYALGLQLGARLKGLDVDLATLSDGIKDGQSDAKPLMTEDEIDNALNTLQKAAVTAVATKNQKDGDAFLAANAKKDGVKTTASGLQYKVLTSGAGKSPKATDIVSVNYRGTLIDGKQFDASDGKPVEFPVNGVIPGWTEALQLMKEGDKFQLVIPAALAYGTRGAGPDIGPNAVLVFEVELMKVKAPTGSPIQVKPGVDLRGDGLGATPPAASN
jgi:FKBP-type peptidyl-prolyl cis-trans isomerase FklB